MAQQQRIPKILIISSDTGGGHRSAAAAIVAGVQKFFEGESYAIRVVRAVEESHHLSAKLVRLYNWILRNRNDRALPSAYNQVAFTARRREVDKIARVSPSPLRQARLQFSGNVGEVCKTGSDDDVARMDRITVIRSGDEMCVRRVEPLNVPRHRCDVLLLLKPFRVRKVKLERKRFDVFRRLPSLRKKVVDGVDVSRIEMPITRGAQVHPGRHILAPKLHRPANDDMLDAKVRRLRCHRQPKRPRADDEQICFVHRHPVNPANPLILSTIYLIDNGS